MRYLIVLLLSVNLWAATYTSSGSGNWSSAATWGGAGVPGNGDTVSIANGHTVTADQNATVGASGAPVYSYVSAIAIGSGGSGGSGACTVTFSGGTQPYVSPAKATCTLSGGAVNSVTLTDRGWYTGASAQPTCAFSATGLTGASCTVTTWVQGGGIPAIHLNASGQLVIATGAALTVRGSIQYTGGTSNTTDSITMQPGSGLIFDSSQAAGAPIYDYGQTVDYGFRNIHAVCTANQRCSISATGNIGVIGTQGFLRGGGIVAKYVDFSNLGDALTPNQIAWGSAVVIYDIEHSTFTNCGRWQYVNQPGGDNTFIHANNVHTATNDVTPLQITCIYSLTTGTRRIVGNVFDTPFGNVINGVGAAAYTVTDNFFGGSYNINAISSSIWTSFTGNFIREVVGGNHHLNATNDFIDNYVFLDGNQDNPHVVSTLNSALITVRGNIFSHSEDIATDSGELLLPSSNPATPTPCYFLNNIILPDRKGYEWAEATSVAGTNPNFQPNIDHNVWFGGPSVGNSYFGAAQINEAGLTPVHGLQSLRSNIMWNPAIPSKGFMKVNTQTLTNPQTDAADPDLADYNLGWHFLATQPNCTAGCTNMGNGYGGAWSKTPGAHDLNADPRFADYQRTMELFDSKYLGHVYPDWSGAASYSVGNEVSHAVAGYSWGLPTNYRYINTVACGGANPEPGNTAASATWRNCWEFSSLYRLREGLRLEQRFTDGAIGASNDTIIMALIKWTRRGYTPQDPAMWVAGHDAESAGAVPFAASARAMIGAIQ